MKEERNIITMNEFGNVVMPKDIQATAMSEWELCELFNVTAPTIRAGIKTLCKNGILNECEIRHTIRLCLEEIFFKCFRSSRILRNWRKEIETNRR